MTTALAGLMLNPAYALDKAVGIKGNLSVDVGGTIDLRASSFKQKKTKTLVTNEDKKANWVFATNKDLSFNIEGMSDMGMTYGGMLRLEDKIRTDSGNNMFEVFDAKKGYVFVESNMGKVMLGMVEGATTNLKVDSSKIAAATGGVNGDHTYRYYGEKTQDGGANSPGVSTTTLRGRYLEGATLFVDNSSDKKNANKFVYMTPKFNGIQAAVSYAPDMGAHGARQDGKNKLTTNSTNTAPIYSSDIKNLIEAGIMYDSKYNDLGVKGSIVGISGKTKKFANSRTAFNTTTTGTTNYTDLAGYALGLGFEYNGATATLSYGDLGSSLIRKLTAVEKANVENKKRKTTYWDAGLGYRNGPIGMSVSYLSTNRWDNTLKSVSFGVDYMLASGLTPYAEYTTAEYKSKKDAASVRVKNTGNVFYIGTALKF